MVSSILILGGCFVVWAVVHSLLASLPVKGWARRRLGAGVDRWYRLAYVAFAGVTLVPILGLVAILPDRTLYSVAAPWRWLMVGGQVLALVALVAAVMQTGPSYFLGLAQLFDRQPTESGSLYVCGFYRWVRHPLYLFSIILIWLTPAMTVNVLTLYALITLYFVVGSVHEENRLVAEFGAAYRDYQKQVPRLVPWPGRRYGCPTGGGSSDG